jgi:hypothetical protein
VQAGDDSGRVGEGRGGGEASGVSAAEQLAGMGAQVFNCGTNHGEALPCDVLKGMYDDVTLCMMM